MENKETGACGDTGEVRKITEEPQGGVQEENELQPLDRIQRNELIAEKISRFLTLADMKEISEASNGFCKMMRSTRAFNNKAVLLICKETIQLPNLLMPVETKNYPPSKSKDNTEETTNPVVLPSFLVHTEFPWKIAQIDVSIDNSLVDVILDILQTIHTLQFKLTRTDNVETKALVDFLIAVISNTPNLTHLQMESGILESVLHDVFSDAKVQTQLQKLVSLEICSWIRQHDATHYIDGDEGEEGPFPRNFLQLSMLSLKLETFKLSKIDTMSGSETAHVKFIPGIVDANRETLKVLSLHLNVWKLDEMKSIRCPQLKSLHLTSHESNEKRIVAFLTNQPLLEELEIDMREGFPMSVFSVIQGRCSKLKKLHITTKCFSGIQTHEPINWQFLSSMENLGDFAINKPASIQRSEQFGTGAVFLSVLPSKLKKMRIRGIDIFWFNPSTNDDVPMAERIVMLNKFQNLTHLSLIRCEDCVNDELIQNIFQEFRQLQVLELSHCSTLTNAGLNGVLPNGERSNFTLKSLTGLTELKLRVCPSLTPEGILEAVALPYLRSFDYLSVIAASKEFLLQIVEQNPSLECLSAFISELDCELELKGELKAKNPRLWRFCNLNDDSWVYQDSESDADENNLDFGDNDSSISGSGFNAYMMQQMNDDFYDHVYSGESDDFDYDADDY